MDCRSELVFQRDQPTLADRWGEEQADFSEEDVEQMKD